MNKQLIQKLAQNLYSGHQKDTTGSAAKLQDADESTQQLWARQAKRAVKIIMESNFNPTNEGANSVRKGL